MIKKLAVVALFVLLPALASAVNMQVTSSALPATGGSITPKGIQFFAGAANYTITVNSGWSISSVLIDNVASPDGISTSQTVPYDTSKTHTIKVTFTQGVYSITTSAGTGGQIQVTGGGQTGITPGSSRTVTVSPLTGYWIQSYTVDNGAPVVPAAPSVAASIDFTNITANHSVSAIFTPSPVITVSAGTNQTVPPSGNAPWSTTLSGSATSNVGAITYHWNLVSVPVGATASFGSPTSATTQFSVNAIGNYNVTLTATSGGVSVTSAPMMVTMISPGLTESNICISCHAGQAPVSSWQASRHALAGPFCSTCHNPNLALPHPGSPLAALYQLCGACHFDTSGNVPLHPVEIGVNTCVTCHDPHSTASSWLSVAQSAHYNNITSGQYPASYVTSRTVCADCHFTSISNGINRHEWAISGHAATTGAAWTAYDFKTMNGCVQCHTATGFIAYSSGKVTAAWGTASDKTKEVLRCNGCHSDISNGTVRTFTPLRPYVDDTYTNPDAGKSNVCLACHSGRKNGRSITVKIGTSGAFANMSFINPHYMASGGTLYGVGGYQFPGRTYTSDFTRSHRDIDSVDTNNTVMGPCITCHRNAFFDHTFRPTWGNNPLCITCHSTMSDTQLTGAKTSVANALEVLRAQLAAKGFVYSPAYPHFSSTNWGFGVAGANTMGAAFNYILLQREPGAYAHNPSYAKQLVLDSIDYLDNGVIDDSVTSIALPALVASGAISQAVADSLSSYKAVNNQCTSCHGGTASTASPMATNAHPAHLTGAYGPGSYLGSTVSACQACHVYNSTTHMNGVTNLAIGAGSACLGCHAGAAPSWTSAARLGCTTCHAATPAVLPNGVAAPYKGSFTTTGHGRFAASNQCTVCHDPDSSHISGSLDSHTRLRLLNDNNLCASCHNNAAVVSVAYRNMVTHVTKDGRALACIDCHDPHGTTNLSMIRGTINGSSIVYTNSTNEFVNLATNRGLCQVCHTLTTYFRAGVPEPNHYTSGCLNCHSHNSAGGAFKPNGGTCDACHGYPPLSADQYSARVSGTYVNAKVEDFAGGGGHHTTHLPATVSASEGFTQCLPCHSSFNHNQGGGIVARANVNVIDAADTGFRFDDSRSKRYNNSTLSCSNVSCHFQPTASWY